MSKIYTDLDTVLTPYATAIKKNASDITSLNGSLELFRYHVETNGNSYTWEHGSFNADGTEGRVQIRIRTDYIRVNRGETVSCSADYGAMVVYFFDTSKTFVPSKSVTTWTNARYTVQEEGYIRLSLRKPDNSDISLNEFDGLSSYITVALTAFGTDKTLTVDGAIADAKATGEKIELVGERIPSSNTVAKGNKLYELYNPYQYKGQLKLKGQMHCHTNNSDGTWSPQNLVERYAMAEYDFITITDHNRITPEPSNNTMVWLCNSYEDTYNSAGKQHCNIFNADSLCGTPASLYNSGNTVSDLVDYFVDNGNGIVCYNHPEYPPVYATDETLENLPIGVSFVEVWNGTIQSTVGTVATVSDLPSTARYGDMYNVTAENAKYVNTGRTKSSPNWIVASSESYPEGNLDRGFYKMLDSGKKVFCLAVDDCHFDSSFNYGWIVAFVDDKSQASIWNAIMSGAFYASSGVTYKDVSCKNGNLSVEIDPVDGETYTTTFYGSGNTVLATVTGTMASYEITGAEDYVRAVTVSSKNLQTKAWTQPVWIRQVKGQYEF